jgi:ABC-2 type transport system ATP-binding protein
VDGAEPAAPYRGPHDDDGTGWMIEARSLTKQYGDKTAVDGLTFTVRPGVVTGFLGPNGAGKSTTMRMIVGLDRPTAGSVTVNGRRYADLRAPLHEVGALLEARAVHTSRSAYNHLRALAATHGIPRRRVDEVIELVGLGDVARKRAGSFSLGMGQRLGIASALLGDPPTVILDEPVNGLDPEGIRWVRDLLKGLAAEGRTVFVSSHLMSEMALTADHLIVIGRGRLLADVPTREFIDASSGNSVRVRSPQVDRLAELLRGRGTATSTVDGYLQVEGVTPAEVGDLAAANGLVVHELFTQRASLEAAFMEMTGDSVEYHADVADVGGSATTDPSTQGATR